MGFPLVIWGSSDFTVRLLDGLEERGRIPAGVVTVADRPAGRGLKNRPTPVSRWAEARKDVKLLKMVDPRDPGELERVRSLGGDMGIIASFGRILPPGYLKAYPLGFVNVHPSLLPELRGAAPIQRAIMWGYGRTGVTLAYLDEGMDTGDIIEQREEGIAPEDDAAALEEKLTGKALEMLLEVLVRLERGERLEGRPQPREGVTYAPALRKEEFEIDWNAPRETIRNKVRALSPRPGAHTHMRGRRLRVLRCIPVELAAETPGTLRVIGKERLAVHAQDGALEIITLQPEGSRAMSAGEFLRGYHPGDGELLSRA